ncbi:ParB/RepB/Spo0J family partition protein [Acidaminobacterium chupaoyuni]
MASNKGLGHGLGKGLDSLFGEESHEKGAVCNLRIRQIEPNPNQPRRAFSEEGLAELADSIRKNGVIAPIAVRKTGETYQIIAGERRWRASRMAGLDEIPAVVLEADEQLAFELALIENLQREDLNPVEEAEGYRELMDRFALTQENIAEKVGKSRPAVANALRLLSLPPVVVQMVKDGALSQGHARTLLGAKKEETILAAAKTVLEEGLSVRQTEKLVKRLEQEKETKKPAKDAMTVLYLEELEQKLGEATGRRIAIHQGREKGKITIEYYGNEDLETLTQALMQIKQK